MLPQIKAGESLRSLTEIALGNGRISKVDQQQIIRDWRKTANGGVRQRMTKDQAAVMLASIGITVETKKHG